MHQRVEALQQRLGARTGGVTATRTNGGGGFSAVQIERGVASYVAAVMGCGADRVREAMRRYDPERLALSAPHTEMAVGAARPWAPDPRRIALTESQIQTVRAFVKLGRTKARTYTWQQLHKFMVADFKFEGSCHTARRRLMDAGFRVLKTTQRPKHDFSTDYWHRQRERLCIEMAEAFEEEDAGRAVVVWMDESFIHTHHHRKITVVDTTDAAATVPSRRAAPKAVLPIGAGAGQLQIVVHAMSRDGLLHDRDDDGEYQRDPTLTAQLIYKANRKGKKTNGSDTTKEQYHAHWDGDSFLLWVRRALLPVIQKLYGDDCVMYLVLDNSGNHCRRPKGAYLSPSSATKTQIAEHLQRHGITHFSVDRGEVTVPATRGLPPRRGRGAPTAIAVPEHKRRDVRRFNVADWAVAGPVGPYIGELQTRLRQLYTEQPHLTDSALERLFADGVSAALQPQLSGAQHYTCAIAMTHVCCVLQL